MNIYLNIDKGSDVYDYKTFFKVSILHNKCAPKVMGHEEKNAWPCNWKEKEQRASYKTNIHSVIFWLVSLNPTYKLMSWKGQGKAFSEETLFIWVTSVLCGFGFMQLGFTSRNRSLFF